MKRICRTIALLAMVGALSLCAMPPVSATVYLDVQNVDWFSPAVSYVVRKGLFLSVAPGQFAPKSPMSRAMFYTVLSRMAQADVDDSALTGLSDVPAASWFTGAVAWAVDNGIADPLPDGSFGVDTPISRVELCLALTRYDQVIGIKGLSDASGLLFQDLGGLSEEQVHAVAVCQTAGVIQGQGGGLFAPQNGASRAEVAQILQNFCLLPAQEAPPDTLNLARPWDNVTGWSGELAADFPLSQLDNVTNEQILWLNKRILNENIPARVAPQGTTLDGNPKHLTNYGTSGLHDCINVGTILLNKNNQVDAGVALGGNQEYYGYSLQIKGTTRQDRWHATAAISQKDPWQCTWWVWGRAAQYLELAHNRDFTAFCAEKTNFGHGKDYYSRLRPYFRSDKTPAANSIISWTAGTFGHVAYVEAVDADGIWVTMADSGHTWRGVTYIAKTSDPQNPYPLYWYPTERLNGFNHLDYAADGTPLS